MIQIHSSRPYLGDATDAIYGALSFMPITQCVDVGAGEGKMAQAMLDSGPDVIVHAFEPFPNNHVFIKRRCGDNPRLRLHGAAVGTKTGKGHLHVKKTVQGTERGWEGKAGYSSLGRMVEEPGEKTLEVDVVSIDEAVPSHISFLKVDVQGGELDVLASARHHFDRRQVDLCYIEFSAEPGLPEFFAHHGWHLFYTPIMTIGKTPLAAKLLPTAERVKQGGLSSGHVCEYLWPADAPVGVSEFRAYLSALKRKFIGAQTDLVCVSPDFMPAFMEGVAGRLRASRVALTPA